MSDYVCKPCGASGVRLYREYQTFADHITLRCTACAMENQSMEPDGPHSIGWLVAALPVDDTFWGYTSAPAESVVWWDALPISARPTTETGKGR